MKINPNESILHDWVSTLTFQQQALLLTAVRGGDGLPKYDSSKAIVRFLRSAIMKPAGEWDGKNTDSFMWGSYSHIDGDGDTINTFRNNATVVLNNHDHIPHHFLMHLIHCAEVLGYKHPDNGVANEWNWFYTRFCESFHMMPETCEQMDERLNDFVEEM